MTTNEKILEALQEFGTFFYATVDNGQARVRPFGLAMLIDDKLYYSMGAHKESYDQTVANPYIEISACAGSKWIRIRGKAILDETEAAKAKMFEANPQLTKMYNDENGRKLGIFYLSEIQAKVSDLGGTSEVLA